MAVLIGRKIAEEGIEGGHQLQGARASLTEEWESTIEEAIAKDIYEGLDILFSTYFN